MIVVHEPGQFSGDIDLLTGRPVIVNAVARGNTRVLCIPGNHLRALLNRVPSFGEKLIVAFTRRRELLSELGTLGLRIVGPGRCRDTNTVREFLYKNFVPFTWFDSETEEGKKVLTSLGSPKKTPAIECGNGQVLVNPSLHELAAAAGIWRACPSQEVDFVIVGAGPAGIAAAVYASSEGLSTLMLDRLGPGGQAGGSSRIENFIGFPAGLSGADLATRGVLQMLKFGAQIVTPVTVEKLTPAKTADDLHMLHLDCGAEIRSRVVLLALGVRWRRLEATGADRFAGAGIYYACTTVEADLYDGTDVAVVGAGNSAGQAVMFLAECCPTRTVHMLIRHTLGPGMSEYLSSRIRATANVMVHEQTEIDAVDGSRRMEEISLNGKGVGALRRLPCSAVFVFIGAEPSAEWLPAEIARDAQRLPPDRYRRNPFRIVAARGSRPLSAGNDSSWRAGRRGHSCRVHQTSRLRSWRRIAGGYLRTSFTVDPAIAFLMETGIEAKFVVIVSLEKGKTGGRCQRIVHAVNLLHQPSRRRPTQSPAG